MPLRPPRPPPLLVVVLSCSTAALAGGLWLGHLASITPEFVGDTNTLAILLKQVEYGDTQAWNAVREPFLTDKWNKADMAEGLLTLAGVFGAFFVFGYLQYVLGAKYILSPPRKWVAPALLVAAGIGQLPFVAVYFARTVERGCCPSWADSAAIPIGGVMVSTFMYLLVFGTITGFMFLSGTRPSALFRLQAVSQTRQVVGTTLAIITMLPAALFLLSGIAGLSALVPLGAIGVWCSLAARSSLISGADLRVPT